MHLRNDYVEEPLPEEEQIQPPAEDADDAKANATTINVEENEISSEAV